MTTMLLEGKVALITGASSGIGLGTATVFARYGARLVLVDIDGKGGEAAAVEVRRNGGEAIFVEADVTRSGDVEAAVRSAVSVYGRLDCAFNNAGIEGGMAVTDECSEESWAKVLGVNLTGVWLCMKHEIRQMLAQGGGTIVNSSSVAGLVGLARFAAYSASKHGVLGLTRSAAAEYAQRNIRINAVCPAVIRTPMVESVIRQGAATEAQITAPQPLRRLGTTTEVAEAVAWLCSDRASFMVGHAMAVDGGWTAV